MSDEDIARQCGDTMWLSDPVPRDLGIEVEVTSPGSAVARLEIRANMANGHGVCHGGYIFTLADTAFAFACNTYDRVTLAASATIEFVRPGRLGETLTATATETHRGGRTGIYDVRVTREDGTLVALFRGRSHATSQPLLETDT